MPHPTKSPIYSDVVLELLSALAHYCALMEASADGWIPQTGVQLLSVLGTIYTKTLGLPHCPAEPFAYTERMVTEDMYNEIKERMAQALGEDDVFLETELHDMRYSDTPIAVSLSEYFSDLYQAFADTTWVFRQGNEESMRIALSLFEKGFREEWGVKLLAIMKQLHLLLDRQLLPEEQLGLAEEID